MPQTILPQNPRIAVKRGDPPIAYRPGNVIVDDAGRAALERLIDKLPINAIFDAEIAPGRQWYIAHDVPDPIDVVDKLVRQDVEAHLNVVYFANGCSCGCPPHPAFATGYGANPWSANPWSANPWSANPWSANAETLNTLATGEPPTSSAKPALQRALPVRPSFEAEWLVIGVLDSGLAGGLDNGDQLRPSLLGESDAALGRISGDRDDPDQAIDGQPPDGLLDPVAGHGTFIAGIIEQLTPGCTIHVKPVFEPQGDVDVAKIATALTELMQHQPKIVNLSFGGTGHAPVLEEKIKHYRDEDGVVFVAAAGNEGSCVEQYPAALPTVVGVGALGPCGPAPWSNYGCWVDACAPGTDLVSSFFARFNGAHPAVDGIDPDDFEQWAMWSGTSFAAPVVVAALAREMATTKCLATQAVERVIEAPHLARIPYLGTIVNF